MKFKRGDKIIAKYDPKRTLTVLHMGDPWYKQKTKMVTYQFDDNMVRGWEYISDLESVYGGYNAG